MVVRTTLLLHMDPSCFVPLVPSASSTTNPLKSSLISQLSRTTRFCPFPAHRPNCSRIFVISAQNSDVDSNNSTTTTTTTTTTTSNQSMSPLNSSSSSSSKRCEQTELLNEQMSAYFASNDTTFQPKLAPMWSMGFRNFVVELDELVSTLRRAVGLEPPVRYTPPNVLGLRLSNEAVANREREREFSQGPVESSAFVRTVYTITCQFLDIAFNNRPIPRFWFLETVARMPYFAYSSCLHLYATLGWYRSPTMMNMHHAEELNEAYHLSVMESLGGDKSWLDRFLAFHASLVYYWSLVILFFISPADSYRFSELIEMHAVDTYSEFLESNEAALKNLPAPSVAHEYYNNFMYYFQEFQMTAIGEDEAITETKRSERPKIENLYDVFDNIVRDELEHSRTMTACTKFINNGESIFYNGRQVQATWRGEKAVSPATRREFWKKWTNLKEQHEGQGKKRT